MEATTTLTNGVTAKTDSLRKSPWAMRQVWHLISDLGPIILFEIGNSKKAKAFLAGIGHELVGRLGPLRYDQTKVLE